MSLIHLNFADLLTSVPSWKHISSNYYSECSLQEQFEQIKLKYGLRDDSLQELISRYFPEDKTKEYHISFPTFERKYEERNGYFNYNNLVIRSENVSELPEGYSMVLIGDVSYSENTYNKNQNFFVVKGFEFIDSTISKYGEKRIRSEAVLSFEKKGKFVSFPSKSGDSAIAREQLDDLLNNYQPVPNYDEAMLNFQEWKDYLGFRKELLQAQANISWQVKTAEFIDAYEVAKADYYSYYDDYRFSDKTFEPIILNTKVDGSEYRPLIKLVFEDDVNRSHTKSLRRETNPNNYQIKLRFEDTIGKEIEMIIGERYLFQDAKVVGPDCSDLERKYQKQISEGEAEIKKQFQIKIQSELTQQIEDEKARIIAETPEVINQQEIHYCIELFEEQPSNIKNEATAIVNECDRKIENINKSFAIRSRGKSGDRLKAQEETLQRNINNIERQKETRLKSLAERIGLSFDNQISVATNPELKSFAEEQRRKIEAQYEAELQDKINLRKEELKSNYLQAIQSRKEKGTKSITVVYFFANGIFNSVSKNDFEKAEEKASFIGMSHDFTRERAKLNRQQAALENFYGGVIKNPYLPLQLISPQSINTQSPELMEDPQWCIPSLNAKQRSAVKLALHSDGLFLLQGPPGTGKTQVIAELAAQLAKSGKKVAISSETHKAIENAFNRLPKIPEIRPFKLSRQNKNSEYRPELLVNNFYNNIVSTLKEKSNQLKNPEERKQLFKEGKGKIEKKYSLFVELKQELILLNDKKEGYEKSIEEIKKKITSHYQTIEATKERISCFEDAIEFVKNCDLNGTRTCADLLSDFRNSIFDLILSDGTFGQVNLEDIQYLFTTDLDEIRNDLLKVKSKAELNELIAKNKELKHKKLAIMDELTEDALPGHEDEWEELRIRIINSGKRIKTLQEQEQDISKVRLVQVVGESVLMSPGIISQFIDLLFEFRGKISKKIQYSIEGLNRRENEYSIKVGKCNDEIENCQNQIIAINAKIREIKERDDYSRCAGLETELRMLISEFIRKYVNSREYSDIESGIEVINAEWRKILRNSKKMQEQASIRLPMYQKICDYLTNEDLQEEDKARYTKALADRVNVYGFTSSSGQKGYDDLAEYGIGDINLQNSGIDVVIIDEVSKSSYIDLLVPILYGKSVIFVGDHRQLPPSYDLSHMKKEDFSALKFPDSDWRYELNTGYTEMYQSSYFKSLFEKVPDSRRESLQKQYRCHSQIMDVFNHFYGGSIDGLQVGEEMQDQYKQHKLSVVKNGKTLFDPEKHVYFIDCKGFESGDDESTSIKNDQEADVVKAVLSIINDSYESVIKEGKIANYTDANNNIVDERLSAGVICTYRLQAQSIRKLCKGKSYKGFTNAKDERFMIDTVDNFQGDERDIIIVSMVRSPQIGKQVNSDFIKQFERINVAYSRARCMLIIVGNKDFLENRCRIDLPDMFGKYSNDKHNFAIYKEIIEKTIEQKGRVLSASDVLGE